MNTFLLFITIGLLILRIKKMPRMLSEKRYYIELKKSADKLEGSLSFYNQDLSNKMLNISMWLVVILYGLFGIYYVVIGTYINSFTFNILTFLQLMTLIINCSKQKLSIKWEDQTFHRWLFLSNVVLDLMYYPYAIYLLIR